VTLVLAGFGRQGHNAGVAVPILGIPTKPLHFHPLRAIRAMAEEALQKMSKRFDAILRVGVAI
jgi:hypothetical protein